MIFLVRASFKFAFASSLFVTLALLNTSLATAAPRTMQVFIAGDSTAAEYAPERYPQLGWGMVLKCAFRDDVIVHDYAQSGRSSKSFVTQGFFARIEREIRKGDTLLIQFGHNDAKIEDPARYTNPDGDYRTWLMRYVTMARAKGARPVLITPVTRRKFENGVLIDTHEPYAKAMREVATASQTPLIDLTADSMRWIASLGDQASKQHYLVYTPEERNMRLPQGHEDNTHFSEIGARKVAELIAVRLAQLKLPVSARVMTSRPGLTRDSPLGGPSCTSPGLIVATATGASYSTLQGAIDALPAQGGEITLAPGIYREKIAIGKPNVRLQGVGSQPHEVVIVWGDGAVNVGGTFKSATLHVSADNFRADHLTIQNDYSLRSTQLSQAVALSVTADRAVFTRVRLIGAQDTLFAGSAKCEPSSTSCHVSRQYFRDCYIEGHVDFIFGDSKAFFDHCEIHALAHDEILLTAHARTAADQDRAYVFDHCLITADAGARNIYFGRPWRDYAAVVFMNTDIRAELNPAGWREWHPGETQRLQTAYYAEYRSIGPGANTSARDPHAHALSDAEAAKWSLKPFLSGDDGWEPNLVR